MIRHIHSLLFLFCLLLVSAALFAPQQPKQVFAAQALTGMTFTMYHPIASDSGNHTVEGGAFDMFGKPIVTATDIETARAGGDSTAGDINHPITLAADKSHAGEVYLLPTYSFTTVNPDGSTTKHTVTNVYGKVSDTGSAFVGQPEKIDIATDHAASQSIANKEDGLSNNTSNMQFIPANDQAERFAGAQGTHAADATPTGVDTTNTASHTTNSAVQNAVQSTSSGGFGAGFMWVTIPFCFKATGPAGRGFTAPALTCNGGLLVVPPAAPVPLPDCGPGSILCTIPTGCLNLVCKASNNAIWDPISHTCGCG